MFTPQGTLNTSGTLTPPSESNGAGAGGAADAGASSAPQEKSNTPAPYSPYARLPGGRAGIPAWQMAASKKAETSAANTAESGTATEVDGASNSAGP